MPRIDYKYSIRGQPMQTVIGCVFVAHRRVASEFGPDAPGYDWAEGVWDIIQDDMPGHGRVTGWLQDELRKRIMATFEIPDNARLMLGDDNKVHVVSMLGDTWCDDMGLESYDLTSLPYAGIDPEDLKQEDYCDDCLVAVADEEAG